MPDEKEDKKAKAAEPIFGVYQRRLGSLTLGPFRSPPNTAVPVPPEAEDLACGKTSPVKFFKTEKAAQSNIAELKPSFEEEIRQEIAKAS